ncbi:MAG: NADH-quinone oxidoreductase subunit C [Candidatus Micrarchaeia archaeon]
MQEIKREALLKTLEGLKTSGYDVLKFIFAVDYTDHMEMDYVLYSTSKNQDELVKAQIDAKVPKIESIMDIYPSADWYEREAAEMFGIKFTNRKTKKLLLEEWNGAIYPLRKDYQWGTDYKKR